MFFQWTLQTCEQSISLLLQLVPFGSLQCCTVRSATTFTAFCSYPLSDSFVASLPFFLFKDVKGPTNINSCIFFSSGGCRLRAKFEELLEGGTNHYRRYWSLEWKLTSSKDGKELKQQNRRAIRSDLTCAYCMLSLQNRLSNYQLLNYSALVLVPKVALLRVLKQKHALSLKKKTKQDLLSRHSAANEPGVDRSADQ